MDTPGVSNLVPSVRKTKYGSGKNPAISSNDDFAIKYLGFRTNGHRMAFMYEVCRLRRSDAPYYWVLTLWQMAGLAEGRSLQDFVLGATRDGVSVYPVSKHTSGLAFLGLDPATQLEGFRFEGSRNAKAFYTILFDTSVLEEGCILGVGDVLAATKAGNEDIRNADVASPGYLRILGPVCSCVPRIGACEAAFAFARGCAKRFDEFAILPPHNGSWGWTNGPFEEGIHQLEIRAMAGPSEPTCHLPVGMLYVLYHGGTATVSWDMEDNYVLEDVHLYIGTEPLPRDARGDVTATPVHFPYTENGLGGAGDHTFVVCGLFGPVYVVAHAIVCRRQ